MELFERIRVLRNNELKLSQKAFGEKLGVSRSVVANIELNVLARPEQKEPLIRLICKTFNVSYDWLANGQGEMYIKTKQSIVAKLTAEYGLSTTAQKIIESYINLNEDQRDAVDKFMRSVADALCDTELSAKKTGSDKLPVIDRVLRSLDEDE